MAIHPLPVILASTSQSRTALLTKSGIEFTAKASNFDEASITLVNPDDRVVALAKAKIETVVQDLKQQPALYIGADTVVVFDAKVMEKPKFKMTALAMLKELSGHTHVALTGYAIYNSYKEAWHTGITKTYITFRELTVKEMTDYVNDNPVTQWSGGYNSFLSSAINFISKVEGSLSGMNGLPLETIIPILHHEWSHPYKSRTTK
jgi:septum formation protein